MKNTDAQNVRESMDISRALKFGVFFTDKHIANQRVFTIYRKPSHASIVWLKTTKSSAALLKFMKAQIATRSNPTAREDDAAAENLARRFIGRDIEDDEIESIPRPHLPKAMARIGKIFAIEYLAERDGEVYRFRHVFKAKSRPALAVSPDGKIATMLGGAWHFGQDGFEDS